ncbi:MAG: DUF2239 family protein [Alphaproteobacteria bacterium]|nr:DUF2239 family protein [Alphaproteobacteria bacterium]
MSEDLPTYAAFDGPRCIARGTLADAAVAVRAAMGTGAAGPLLVFDCTTGQVVDLDLRGSPEEVAGRVTPGPARGRPKLGVVPREVTLLPQHWAWLNRQPGGASAMLRRLVDAARRSPDMRRREARDAAYRFIAAMAGDLPGFEEASRALFAGDAAGFTARLAAWPADVRDLAMEIAREA